MLKWKVYNHCSCTVPSNLRSCLSQYIMQHKWPATLNIYYNFAGSPTACTAIPSSDGPLPLSPSSPSALVSGLSQSSPTNAGEYNCFTYMLGKMVVHGNCVSIWEWCNAHAKISVNAYWEAFMFTVELEIVWTSQDLSIFPTAFQVHHYNIPASYINSVCRVIHIYGLCSTHCLCRVHPTWTLDNILHRMFM